MKTLSVIIDDGSEAPGRFQIEVNDDEEIVIESVKMFDKGAGDDEYKIRKYSLHFTVKKRKEPCFAHYCTEGSNVCIRCEKSVGTLNE